MTISRITLLVISIFFAVVNAVPVSKRSVWTGGRIIEDQDQWCKKIPADVAQYCGYNHTFFRNDKGHHKKDMENAYDAFMDFVVLIDARCSSYLGPFLCHYYFPLSTCANGEPIRIDVLPCKETCEDAKTDACYNIARSFPGLANWTWSAYFPDCNGFESKADTQTCSYGENTKKFTTTPVVEPEEPNVTEEPEEPEEPKEPEEPEEPEEPTTKAVAIETTTKALPECPNSCDIREIANGKTFHRNDYTYALKATVSRKLGVNRYNVTVLEDGNYDVSTCNNGGKPEIGATAIIIVPHDHCPGSPNLNATIGQTVIIAGNHKTASDGSSELYLDCTDKPLFGDWLKKYDKRDNIKNWTNCSK